MDMHPPAAASPWQASRALSCYIELKTNAFPFISFSDSPQIEGDFPHLQEGTDFSILCSQKSPEHWNAKD